MRIQPAFGLITVHRMKGMISDRFGKKAAAMKLRSKDISL
jgi:hypothetical protein